MRLQRFRELTEEYFPEIPKGNQGGSCYEDAFNYFSMKSISNKKLKLVHGLVTGQGPIEGVVYGHAWVEDGNTVIDATKKPVLKLPKQLYYAIGGIKKSNVFTYDRAEVSKMINEFKTYGPWEQLIIRNKY